MPRYIDADKTMEEIDRIGGHNLCEWETLGVKALIDRQPTADVVPKSEIEEWVARCRDWHEVGELKCREIERLRSILLQFTDIVHKWGVKNNIDTSEISLVPILQQEADSIIKKANQELASEIFAEIESKLILNKATHCGQKFYYIRLEDDIAELKKKYTEGEE